MTALLMLEGGSRQVLTRGEDVTFNIINLLRPWDDQSSGKLQFGAVSLDNRRNLDTSDYNLGGHVFTFKVKAEQSFQVIAKYEGQDVMYSPLHLSAALAPNDEEDNLMETSVMKVGSPDVEVVDASGPSSPRSGSSPAPVQTEVKKLQCHIYDDGGQQRIVRLGSRPAEEIDIMKDPETETFVRGTLGLGGRRLGNLKIQDIDMGSDDSNTMTIDFTKVTDWKVVPNWKMVPRVGPAGLEHPIGIAVLEDRFIVSSKGDCKVKMYKKDGTFLKELFNFDQPSDMVMVILKDREEGFALRERNRVVVLNKDGKLINTPWRGGGMRYGLAQDDSSQLVCLNITNNENYLSVYNGRPLYKIDLGDIIGDEREKSMCR